MTFSATAFSTLSDCPTKGRISTGSVKDFFFQPLVVKNLTP
jgi:hypothetical protein